MAISPPWSDAARLYMGTNSLSTNEDFSSCTPKKEAYAQICQWHLFVFKCLAHVASKFICF